MIKKISIKKIAFGLGIIGVGLALYYGIHTPRYYTGLYLSDGQLYIGRLSHFPRLALKDTYVVQTQIDSTTNIKNSQLVPLGESVWGPQKVILSRESIIFYGRIGETSDAIRALNSRDTAK